MKTLQIAIVGAGFIGKQHIEALNRIPYTHVAWIVDNDESAARLTAAQMNIPHYAVTIDPVLRDASVDVVHVCTPTAAHHQNVMDAVRAHKHVYCEKPLAMNLQQALDMQAAAQKADVAHGINFNYRHNVMVCEMRQRIAQGSVGKVLTVSGQYLQDWLLYPTDYNWRIEPEVGGASRAMADIGSHCLDTMQYVLGKKIRSLYAKFTTVHPVRISGDHNETFAKSEGTGKEVSVTTEDAAFVMAEFEDGIPGLFHISQVYAGKKNALSISVCAQEASLEWNQEQCDRLLIGKRNAGNEILIAEPSLLSLQARSHTSLPGGHSVGWQDALKNALLAFYTGIRNHTWNQEDDSYVSFADGIQLMRLVEACLTSSSQNCWIDL